MSTIVPMIAEWLRRPPGQGQLLPRPRPRRGRGARADPVDTPPRASGSDSHGRQSYLYTALYISFAIMLSYRKYTGVYENDFMAHG